MPLGIERKYQEVRNSINNGIQNTRDRVIRNVHKYKIPLRVALGVSTGLSALGGMSYGYSAWIEFNRPYEEAKKARIEAEKLARETARKADFEQTAGANLLRGESNSVVVTLRESASLAGSRIDWLNGVWNRIHSETGCDIGSTTYLEPISASGWIWGERKSSEPETYAIALTNCPPASVQSSQGKLDF